MGILFAFFYRYYDQWSPKNKYLYAGNCCALLGILVHNLYSVNMRYIFVAMFFWLTLALQSALLPGPKPEEKVTFSAGRVMASLLPLPLIIWIFFDYSLAIFSLETHFRPAVIFFNNQQNREAEIHIRRALEFEPKHKWSLYYLGIAQYRLDKFPESKQTLQRLIQLDPNYLQVHYWFGNNYYKTQDFQKAKEEYHKSLRLNDAYGPSYYSLGEIALEENDLQQAVTYFEQAYTLKGEESMQVIRRSAVGELIKLYLRLGDEQEARTYVEKLRELEGS